MNKVVRDDGLLLQEITELILGGAFEVHRVLGFKGVALECGYRLDLMVDSAVIVELKAADRLLPIHEAQLLTYMKLMEVRVGLLINFNAAPLRHGIRRLVV